MTVYRINNMTNVIRPNFQQHERKQPAPVKYIAVPAWVIADQWLNKIVMDIQEARQGWEFEPFPLNKQMLDIICVNPAANIRCSVIAAYAFVQAHRQSDNGGEAA